MLHLLLYLLVWYLISVLGCFAFGLYRALRDGLTVWWEPFALFGMSFIYFWELYRFRRSKYDK